MLNDTELLIYIANSYDKPNASWSLVELCKKFFGNTVNFIYTYSDFRKSIKDVDLVIFEGGTDVNPLYYGLTTNEIFATTDSPDKTRDLRENLIYDICANRKIPMLGICRGAQFLTIKNGGKLIQHVTNHSVSHRIKIHVPEFMDFNNIEVTSSHHQMMSIRNMDKRDYILIAGSVIPRSNYYRYIKPSINSSTVVNTKDDMYVDSKLSLKELESFLGEDKHEPEIVFYPNSKSLAIQGHPEYQTATTEYINLVKELINKYLLSYDGKIKIVR